MRSSLRLRELRRRVLFTEVRAVGSITPLRRPKKFDIFLKYVAETFSRFATKDGSVGLNLYEVVA